MDIESFSDVKGTIGRNTVEYLSELTDPLAIIFKILKKGLPEAKIVFWHISNFVIWYIRQKNFHETVVACS